jgi:hypothetical protein
MRFGPGDSFPAPPRFDRKNVAVGAAVSAVLAGVLCYGTLAYVQAHTPREEGVNLGGAMLATFGAYLAIALSAAFTARRARGRQGQPILEGVVAGLAGFTLATCVVVIGFFVDRGAPLQALFEIPNTLTLLLPGGAAAYAGAALGSLHGSNGQTR